MEIKKGDRFRCIKTDGFYTEGKEYLSERDGCITNNIGLMRIWDTIENARDYLELIDMSFTLPDSPTSPSHYKAYDMESIEMMIRIWGKQRVAEWCEITAFKYRCRVGMKDDVQQDLQKEAYYLAKWKELRDDVTG